MSRKGFAAALLLVALSARAQVEIRSAPALPPTPGLFAPAPAAAAVAPEPFALPAAAVAEVSVAAPLPPAEARAAAMSGALAEFARTDLKSVSPGEARGAGETLMLRALGADVADAASIPVERVGRFVTPLAALARPGGRAEPKVYLLSKPLKETVRLGPVALILHVAFTAVWEFSKAAIAYQATGSLAGAGAWLAFELATSPVAMAARSLGHLGERYWRRKLEVLRDLARMPGVSRVKVLTTGEVAFAGPLARRKDNEGLIFVEAEGELPEAIGRFGAPIPLGDLTLSRVRLAFFHEGAADPVDWTPTLKDLLDGRPMPPAVAAAWRARAKGLKTGLKKLLSFSKRKERIEAVLIGADGSERPIGAIAEGPAARKLVGLGLLDRARAILGRGIPSRAIPLSDSVVERPGDARGAGVKAALSRAWRRLTGRLIVAKS